MIFPILSIIKILIALLIFISPGLLLSNFINTIFRKSYLERIYLSIIISISFGSLLGFILSSLNILNTIYIKIIYFLIFITYIITRKISKLRFTPFKITHWENIIIIGLLIISFFSFLMYQHYEYPIGGDANNHFLYTFQLIKLGELPESEIGINSPPYYPRGLHMSTTIFHFLAQTQLTTSYKFFMALLFMCIPFSVYYITNILINQKKTELIATFFTIIYLPLFIVKGNYPMSLAIIYLSITITWIFYTFFKKMALTPGTSIICSLLIVGIINTHLYIFYFFIIIFTGILVYNLIQKNTSFHECIIFFRNNYLPMLIIPVLFLLTTHQILFNQYLYYLNKSTIYSNKEIVYSLFTLRTNVMPFMILYTNFLLFPFFIIGLFSLIKAKSTFEKILIPYTIVSITCFFTSIFPIYGREQYLILYPLILLASYGFTTIFSYQFNKKVFLYTKLVLILFIIIFTVNNQLFIINHSLIGATEPSISNTSTKTGEYLLINNFSNQKIASLSAAEIKYITLFSNNTIIIGDKRYIDSPTYQEIWSIYNSNANYNSIKEIINRYNISLIYVNRKWSNSKTMISTFTNIYGDNSIQFNEHFFMRTNNYGKNKKQ